MTLFPGTALQDTIDFQAKNRAEAAKYVWYKTVLDFVENYTSFEGSGLEYLTNIATPSCE